MPDDAYNRLNLRLGIRLSHLDLSLFADNVANAHPQLSFEHTNPGDPRYQAVTLRPRTIGLTGTMRY